MPVINGELCLVGVCRARRKDTAGCLVVTTQVGRHMGVRVALDIRVGVDARRGRAPVRGGGSKEIGGGDGHGGRMRGYKVDLLLVGVVGRHVG